MSSTNFCPISFYVLFILFIHGIFCLYWLYLYRIQREGSTSQFDSTRSHQCSSGTVRTCDWYIRKLWTLIGRHTRRRTARDLFLRRCTSTANLQENETRWLGRRIWNFHLSDVVLLCYKRERTDEWSLKRGLREPIGADWMVMMFSNKEKRNFQVARELVLRR